MARKFTDSKERAWEIEITVDAVKRIKSLTEVDLLQAIEGPLLQQLASDPVLLCDVVYAAVKPAADQAGVTDEEFGRAMAGDVIDAATQALLESLVDFFPSPRRGLLEKALQKLRTLEAMTVDSAVKALDSPALENVLKAELADVDLEGTLKTKLAKLRAAEKSGGSSTSSPARRESRPAR